jgi:hypothetical protein
MKTEVYFSRAVMTNKKSFATSICHNLFVFVPKRIFFHWSKNLSPSHLLVLTQKIHFNFNNFVTSTPRVLRYKNIYSSNYF